MLKFSGAPTKKKNKEPQSEVRLRNRPRNQGEKENRPHSLILDGNGLGGKKQRPTSFAEKSPTRREFESEQQLSSYSRDDGNNFERARAATDVTAQLGGPLRKSSEGVIDFGYSGVSSVEVASPHAEPHSTAFIHGGKVISFCSPNQLYMLLPLAYSAFIVGCDPA